MKTLAVVALIVTFLATPAFAADFEAVRAKVEAAMAAETRPEADRQRDDNRLPVRTLEFFGLRDDMKVIELMPGGGWYTRLLAPTLRDKGTFFVALGTRRVSSTLQGQPGFENMQIAAEEARMHRPEGSRHYLVEMDGLGVEDADMVLTFRNYHNFAAEGRATLNRAVFEALKPGGTYAVVDHNRRHMEPDNNENRRRIDPVLAIREIEAAGFEFVDYADLHYRADDELRYEVGRKSVTGNTDRFTLKFRKPE